MMTPQPARQAPDLVTVTAIILRNALEERGPEGIPIYLGLVACLREALGAVWGSPGPSFMPGLARRDIRWSTQAGARDRGDC